MNSRVITDYIAAKLAFLSEGKMATLRIPEKRSKLSISNLAPRSLSAPSLDKQESRGFPLCLAISLSEKTWILHQVKLIVDLDDCFVH